MVTLEREVDRKGGNGRWKGVHYWSLQANSACLTMFPLPLFSSTAYTLSLSGQQRYLIRIRNLAGSIVSSECHSLFHLASSILPLSPFSPFLNDLFIPPTFHSIHQTPSLLASHSIPASHYID